MNPHGKCDTCAWHTHEVNSEHGDSWHYWMCWRLSGKPEQRDATTTERVPPACENHLAADLR